jgi:hypothetical protein
MAPGAEALVLLHRKAIRTWQDGVSGYSFLSFFAVSGQLSSVPSNIGIHVSTMGRFVFSSESLVLP